MKLARIGLVVNQRAGVGGERNRAVAAAVLSALGDCQVVAGPYDTGEASDPATTGRVARESAQRSADALVVIGGDGTMADAANALYATRSQLPILGIGAGSTNAGALVAVDHSGAVRHDVGGVFEEVCDVESHDKKLEQVPHRSGSGHRTMCAKRSASRSRSPVRAPW